MLRVTTKEILEQLEKLFPNAKCELNHRNVYELSIAVILSAQTTDERVNLITPNLFEKYPTLDSLASSNQSDVEKIIQSVGLYQTKAKNIIGFSKMVLDVYNGIIPSTIEELVKLPGVGRKTANVIVSVAYNLPGLAVDTHVTRVSKRLGLVNEEDNADIIEQKLKNLFDINDWGRVHHLLIFFGRYMCIAKKPLCDNCPFINRCTKK